MPRPDSLPAWRELQVLAAGPAPRISESFATDPARAQRYSAQVAGLFVDYSKQPVDDSILQALTGLAEQAELPAWIERLFTGEHINHTEDRPVLHMALRQEHSAVFPSEEFNVMPAVRQGYARMAEFCESVRSGHWQCGTGQTVTDVVNLGIGGSDLGPRMLATALTPYCDGRPRVHFVGNGDGSELHETLRGLDPETTLFLVVSKSFTTTETLANAELAREWIKAAVPAEGVSQHFVAISARSQRAEAFGAGLVLPFWDWVGGRFSVWSTVGTALAIAIGLPAFEALLEGARAMDAHFRHAPLQQNLPVVMGLLGIWHTNFLRVNQHVVLPYSNYLLWLPGYLQQLEMESNGKSVDRDGKPVSYATAPALWGEVGTNAQHAFMQRLHQGPQIVPVDFILPLKVNQPYPSQQDALVANCLAQAQALMEGRSADSLQADGASLAEHRVLPGNRPSTMILLDDLSPYCLGALLALYEHKVFVQSVIWYINAFDQWGVEEGKRLARRLLQDIEAGNPDEHDPSTRMLLQRYLRQR